MVIDLARMAVRLSRSNQLISCRCLSRSDGQGRDHGPGICQGTTESS